MYATHFNELSPGKQFSEICPDATLREPESRARIHGIMAGLRCRLLLAERLLKYNVQMLHGTMISA
jgi:hypothetical protein